MRIADRYARDCVSGTAYRDPAADNAFTGEKDGDILRGELRFSHHYARAGSNAAAGDHVKGAHARQSLHRYLPAPHAANVVKIFPDAAYSVAAHKPLTAVAVEHPHFCVGFVRRADEYCSVAAYPEMTVGELYRKI